MGALFQYEAWIRLGCFAGVFALMALWELLAPRRKLSTRKPTSQPCQRTNGGTQFIFENELRPFLTRVTVVDIRHYCFLAAIKEEAEPRATVRYQAELGNERRCSGPEVCRAAEAARPSLDLKTT